MVLWNRTFLISDEIEVKTSIFFGESEMRTLALITSLFGVIFFSGCGQAADSAKNAVDKAGDAAGSGIDAAGDTVGGIAGDAAGDAVKSAGGDAVDSGTDAAKDAIDSAAGATE